MIGEVTERVMEEPGEGLIELEDCARSDQDSEGEEIGTSGNSYDTLDSLRHAKFCEKASKSLTSMKVDKPSPNISSYSISRHACLPIPFNWGWIESGSN
ncbi:hypothetical protein ElyMa_006149900 [Elysia marginata]|uniref:CTNNB1 binding N-teminal domain-containing protein n=1 Tax=Elysia marginata TaxID=1093978 RepID=A0AAV4GYB4_9GAST|nr:hypothetical protein ElyMa_006149900 [Elysia marginata]